MTITNTNRVVVATGNSATTVWPFAFNIPDADSANVELTETATGVVTVISAANYTITGLGDGSGTVTYPKSGTPLASTHTITIYRDVPVTQTTTITNQTKYNASVVMGVWDRIVMMVQDLSEATARHLSFPIGETTSGLLDSAVARASKLQGYDASGNLLTYSITPIFTAGEVVFYDDYASFKTSTESSRGIGSIWNFGPHRGIEVASGDIANSAATPVQLDVLEDSTGGRNVMAFGVVGDGIVDDSTIIQSVITKVEALGGGTIYFPPNTYNLASNQLEFTDDDVTLLGYGATLLNTKLFSRQSCKRLTVLGLRILDDTASGATFLLNFYGSHFIVQDVTLEKDPVAGGYQAYLRSDSSFGNFRNLRLFGSNGIYIAGHDHSFSDCHLESKGVVAGVGGDDGYVIKAAPQSAGETVETYNISITGGTVRGYYNVISIGSEVGEPSAAGDYTDYVRNINVTGVAAYNCRTIVYIKPGALGVDYRDGLVENIAVSNCSLFDPEGVMFYNAIYITTGRGCIVRHVNISNNVVKVRHNGAAVERSFVYLYAINSGSSSTIDHIYIRNNQFVDHFDGAENGVPTPGYPLESAVKIKKLSAGNDTIKNIYIEDNLFRGTQKWGVITEGEPEGPIYLRRNDFQKIAVTPATSLSAGLFVEATTDLTWEDNIVEMENNYAVGLPSTSGDTFDANGKTLVSYLGNVTAGNNIHNAFLSVPKDCYIWKIELIHGFAVTQSDIDYVNLEFRNMGTTNVLISVDTKVTGGIAIPDDALVSLSSNAFTGVNAYFNKGDVLRFAATHGGAGKALTNLQAVIHYMTYGS